MNLLNPPSDPALVLERAYRALARGEPASAEQMLAGLSELSAPLARIARLVEAQAALSRGSLDLALARVERALPPRPPEPWERAELASALGVRAVLRALSGNAAGARRDITRVRQEVPEPSALALARAALAEAVVLARGGDRARLRAHFELHGRHLSRLPLAHESALAMAYARMAGSGHRSVYRQPAGADTRVPSRGLLRWFGQVAPEAAPFVDAAAFTKRLEAARAAPAIADDTAEEPEGGDEGRSTLTGRVLEHRAAHWSVLALVAMAVSTALLTLFFGRSLWVGLVGAGLVALIAVGVALRVVGGSKPAPATPWLSEREALLRALVLRRLAPPGGRPRRRARIQAPRLRIARRAGLPKDEAATRAAEDEAAATDEAADEAADAEAIRARRSS
jgi:hypothetical protein